MTAPFPLTKPIASTPTVGRPTNDAEKVGATKKAAGPEPGIGRQLAKLDPTERAPSGAGDHVAAMNTALRHAMLQRGELGKRLGARQWNNAATAARNAARALADVSSQELALADRQGEPEVKELFAAAKKERLAMAQVVASIYPAAASSQAWTEAAALFDAGVVLADAADVPAPPRPEKPKVTPAKRAGAKPETKPVAPVTETAPMKHTVRVRSVNPHRRSEAKSKDLGTPIGVTFDILANGAPVASNVTLTVMSRTPPDQARADLVLELVRLAASATLTEHQAMVAEIMPKLVPHLEGAEDDR